MAPIPGIAGPGAPYPQWGVVVGSPGQHITKVTNAAAKTVMETVAWPSTVYLFTSQQAAQNWVNGNGGQVYVPGTQTPLNNANNALNTATQTATDAVAVSDFLGRLSNPHTWLRVAEVVVGVAFLIVGLNALLHNPAGKVAKAMPKVVPI